MKNSKIDSKVMHIIKSENIYKVTHTDKGYTLDPEAVGDSFAVGIASANPLSVRFSRTRVSTGMLDQHLPKDYTSSARIDKSTGVTSLVSFHEEVMVDTDQIVFEMKGVSATNAMLVDEYGGGKFMDAVNSDSKGFYNCSLEEFLGYSMALKSGARSNSQSMKGDIVFIKEDKSIVDYLEVELKFNLRAWAKWDGKQYIIPSKIVNRFKLSASSGKAHPAFEDFTYVGKEATSFDGFEGDEIEGMIYHFVDLGNNKRSILIVNEDFEVKLTQLVKVAQYNAGGSIEMLEKEMEFIKPGTDGSMYLDMNYAHSIGMFKDIQARVGPTTKGMINMVDDLLNDLGVTSVFFGGAVKGDPLVYFQDRIETFILGEAADEREPEKDNWLVSNQLVRALATRAPETLAVFESQSKDILERAYNKDRLALDVFLGLDKSSSEDEEEEGEESILDSENLTAEAYMANPDASEKSDMLSKRLSDLIRKPAQDVENGKSYFSQDTSYRHMVSDPYEVVRHMTLGRMAIDATAEDADMKGIAPNHVVSSRVQNGKFSIDWRKAILGRYPLVHELEIQVVNEDKNLFLDKASEARYARLIARGEHQGMLYYSLYDMVAEGQSGADYDGDRTTVIRFAPVTSLISSTSKYLDYSSLDGKMVEGVPWKEDVVVTLEGALKEEEIEYLESNGVVYENGDFTVDTLDMDKEVKELLYKAILNLDTSNNESNNIGVFTNFNATVLELVQLLRDKREEILSAPHSETRALALNLINHEVAGYEKLNFLMASAIRWEIDKSKHGGQFYKELPFLDAITNPESNAMQIAKASEAKYGISMQRLVLGFNQESDKLNRALSSMGISPIDIEEGDKRIRISNSLNLGKGVDKGTAMNSRFDEYIKEMKVLSDTYTKDIFINESRRGLVDEATNYVNMMAEKGIVMEMESSYNARQAFLEGKEINNASRLLASYRESLSEIQKEISEMEKRYISELEESAGGELIHSNNLGLETIMKKARVSGEERDKGYALLARKELLVSQHKGVGEAFTPENPEESALLFAMLYLENTRSKVKSREEAYKDVEKSGPIRKELRDKLNKAWVQKNGNEMPDAETKKNVVQWIEDNVYEQVQSDSGWGSILTLFPLSTIQFLEFIKDERIKTVSAKGINTIIYLEAIDGSMIPQAIAEALPQLEGKEITVDHGIWSKFRLAVDDIAGRNRSTNASPKEMAHLQDVSRFKEIKGMQFERGSHLWNRVRKGKVLFSVAYKEGIKIFLEDSKEVSSLDN